MRSPDIQQTILDLSSFSFFFVSNSDGLQPKSDGLFLFPSWTISFLLDHSTLARGLLSLLPTDTPQEAYCLGNFLYTKSNMSWRTTCCRCCMNRPNMVKPHFAVHCQLDFTDHFALFHRRRCWLHWNRRCWHCCFEQSSSTDWTLLEMDRKKQSRIFGARLSRSQSGSVSQSAQPAAQWTTRSCWPHGRLLIW